jgi:diadenosine tetraphosphate (Ap4A) HIT family hydrolase
MSVEFENAWYDLNLRLRDLELDAGLAAALLELETHHLNSGFIEDTLNQIERHTFYNPDDPTRYFHVQYNPRRALRFAGAGRNGTPSAPRQNGCFLCRDNIEWQQQGAQLGYRVETGGRAYFALTNPFPILPGHIVIASTEHRTQEWRFHDDDGLDVAELIDDLVRLADRMPGHLGFYNGVDAGSSIPGHLHYQFVMRPNEEITFPLEVAAQPIGNGGGGTGFAEHYPLAAVVWKGSVADVVARASDWMARWGERNRTRLDQLSANFIASRDSGDDELALYFVPRDRAKQRADGFSNIAGGLEALGEIVLSSPEEKALLHNGSIDYSKLEAALATLRTPLDID